MHLILSILTLPPALPTVTSVFYFFPPSSSFVPNPHLRPESLGPSSGQRLVDVVAFDVLGWITCWGHLCFIDSLAQQCLDAELSYLVVTVAALTVLISVLLHNEQQWQW